MKYDGFQRVAQRFEVLWPESVRYATPALQEHLSTARVYSNNHPYCPWSSEKRITKTTQAEITENAQLTDVGTAPAQAARSLEP